MRVRVAPILASVIAIAALGACGSDAKPVADATTTTAPAVTTTTAEPAGTTTTATGDQAKNTVGVKGLSFDPAELTIAKGDSVTFENPKGFQHTVTPDVAGAFEEAGRDVFAQPNAAHTITFAEAGTFKFHCAIHGPTMSATITVTA